MFRFDPSALAALARAAIFPALYVAYIAWSYALLPHA
jgi:hypothetical protein